MLVAATNAITRVIEPEWMKPGVHATCVKDCELGEATIRKADRVVLHARNFAPENYIAGFGDEKIAAHDPVDFIRGAKKSAARAGSGAVLGHSARAERCYGWPRARTKIRRRSDLLYQQYRTRHSVCRRRQRDLFRSQSQR